MYTHYFTEHLKRMNSQHFELANRLYRGLLACITTLEVPSITLLDIMQAHGSHMEEIISPGYPPYKVSYGIDKYFHEFTISADNKPMLFPDNTYGYAAGYEFLKTSRKLYDIAVVGVQYTLWMALQIPMSNDSKLGFPIYAHDPLIEYATNELQMMEPAMITQVYNLAKMYELIKEYIPMIIAAGQPDKPGLNLEEIGKDDPTRVGQLTIYGKANVGDLRHIAEQIEQGQTFSPADGMYLGQPSWVFTKS